MTHLTRRRFLTISAAALLMGRPSLAAPLQQWRGAALGAEVTITLAHPEGARIAERALKEIDRLENVFSLYRSNSDLSRLNRQGLLHSPSFELLECLGLCSSLHAASGGVFDPTIQPLWMTYAERYSTGKAPNRADIANVLPLVGFDGVSFDAQSIRFAQSGMALTLNGIAQGYIADKIAEQLRAEGLTDVLVNTGELQAIGSAPDSDRKGWPVSLKLGDRLLHNALHLHDRALASSAPLGTVFDAEGQAGHILDPRSGAPSRSKWRLVSVSAPSAAIADGLSTASCMLTRDEIAIAASHFPGSKLERLI